MESVYRSYMEIGVKKVGDICVLELSGPLRFGEATARLASQSRQLIDNGEKYFVLNMLASDWIDSCGMGEVVAFHKRARERKGVVKLAMRDVSYNQFALCHLEKMFDIFDDESTAVHSFDDFDGGYREKFT